MCSDTELIKVDVTIMSFIATSSSAQADLSTVTARCYIYSSVAISIVALCDIFLVHYFLIRTECITLCYSVKIHLTINGHSI